MQRRFFGDDPEIWALALIVVIMMLASFGEPILRLPKRAFLAPPAPDVRVVIPKLPPPVNPVELIRL